jgi:hypothetical protein
MYSNKNWDSLEAQNFGHLWVLCRKTEKFLQHSPKKYVLISREEKIRNGKQSMVYQYMKYGTWSIFDDRAWPWQQKIGHSNYFNDEWFNNNSCSCYAY